MQKTIDDQSFRTICAAIAASNFAPIHRIKSIAQIAHEALGTSSIIVYQTDRNTDQLDILAMPGVHDPELMRGPTDKVIFQWEETDSTAAREGIWLENDDEYEAYVKELADIGSGVPHNRFQAGDFRRREIAKHGTEDLRLATAKVYLWKGLGQTNDRVGQVFFNFITADCDPVFSEQLRSLVRFVCMIIRELLIEQNFHKNLPSVSFSPEYVTGQLNNSFSAIQNIGRDAHRRLEYEVARIICDAALQITENYGGRSDFIYLIGERLGRAYSSHMQSTDIVAGSHKDKAVVISPDSISGRCIRDKKHYVGNYDFPRVQHFAPLQNSSRIKETPEFGLAPCRSLLVVPVVHESEVRAIIRMASPRKGGFLDEQARAMKTLEGLAKYGIMLLDERRQRQQMAAALGFYTKGASAASVGVPEDLMKHVLSALGAEWGTFWEIDKLDDDGRAFITQGIFFSNEIVRPISPEEEQCGIRVPTIECDDVGFTQRLINSSTSGAGDILCLHIVPDRLQGEGTTDSGFVLQEFSSGFSEAYIPSDSGRSALTAKDVYPLRLNGNTTDTRHSRIAFMVSSGSIPRAVVWLKFPSLHEVAWWERHYLAGLARSLAKFLESVDLQLAIWSFRHFIPSLTSDALAKGQYLADKHANEPYLVDILDYMRTMEMKSAEVQALLPSPGDGKTPEQIIDGFGRGKICVLVDRAIRCATDFAQDMTSWSVEYQPEYLCDREVSGLFYLALLNICKNAVLHGWNESVSDGDEEAAIWIHANNRVVTVCVGNNGEPPNFDPTTRRKEFDATAKGAGTGLQVVRTLLRRCRGRLRYIPPSEFATSHTRAPESFSRCRTFFEFSIPLLPNGETDGD